MVPGTVVSPTQFRVRELLEEAGVGQSEAARDTGLSFATINRLATNATGQVALETLDRLSEYLTEKLGRAVQPGDLIEREPKRRGKK